ncbi:MAG: ABC-F type ribosomal protection protein [Lachnospiraceae bacterium]|nr:ABC-F type ribosomal protection protein [Lachnospiraceae bacterium]
MILACKSIKKAFGTDEILTDCSFHIEERDKAAIVGLNGAGKSTLLKIIIGEQEADAGEIVFAKETTFGYLAQHQDLTVSGTIYDYLLETKQEVIALEQKIRETENLMKFADDGKLEQLMKSYTNFNHRFEQLGGYAYKSEVIGVLKGLGFSESEFHQNIATLSGGQKTRVSLGRLLLTNPDLILLDEPTNHLDMESIRWLETFLANYKGAMIIVAHDRYFLDKIVNKVIEIENGETMAFSGNYTAFREKKEIIRNAQLKAYLNQQQDIKHQQEVIAKLKSFNREKSIKRAESREKQLEKKMSSLVAKPLAEAAPMQLTLEPNTVSGNDVLSAKDLAKSFGDKHLFSGLSFEIKRGERIALIGNNGTGKTTILKMIHGTLDMDAGEIRIGTKVQIGYFDQEHHTLNMEKTIFDEISDTYPTLNQTKIRNVLAAFLFTGEDVFKRIGDLSGGERGRISLAKLMLSEANFLILDEPTNHLDMQSKEILESALNQYTGTLLYVSHDRYFINQTATRILDLANGVLTSYIGNYDYYLEKRETLTQSVPFSNRLTGQQKNNILGNNILSATEGPVGRQTVASSKNDWQQQKEEQARLRKLKSDLEKTETAIMELEARNEELNALFADETVYADVSKLLPLQNEKEYNDAELQSLYELWESLNEEMQ